LKRPIRAATVLATATILITITACTSSDGTKGAPIASVPDSAFKAGPADHWSTGGFNVDPASLKCSAPAPDPTRGITDTSVKVGGLSYLTSPNGSSLAGVDHGAEVRFKRANDEGGVNGRKIDFIGVKDDAQDPARNVQQAQALVDQDKVFAVAPLVTAYPNYIDTLCKNVVPFFGWTTNSGFCGNAIGFGFTGCSLVSDETNRQVANAGIGMWVRNMFGGAKDKAVAVIGLDNDTARAGVQIFKSGLESAGEKVVYAKSPIPISGLNDATPIVSAIMATNGGAGPDLIIAPVDFSTTTKLVSSLRAAGYKGKIVVAAGYDPRLASFADLRGTQTLLQWAPNEANTPGVAQLKADFAKYDPTETLSLPATAGYWSADLFLGALKHAGRNLTVDSFLKSLNDGSFTYSVPGAVPETIWPLNHVINQPCAALVELTDKGYTQSQELACSSLVKLKP
jgi:ABC-type branched-subunit amino acid transport system substrate-binding protein